MTSPFKPRLLSVCLAAALGAATGPVAVHAQEQTVATQRFEIGPGQLDAVLSRFAMEAGITFHMNSELTQGIYSPGIQGNYTPEQALELLLSNTGLHAERQPDGAYRIQPRTSVTAAAEDGVMELGTIDVVGSADDGRYRDQDGYDAVYDKDVSTAYIGKAEVERYKGTNPADLLKGTAGVFSGEARNSGALDLNIRGVQGPGRVPVTVDGTEQALTVWRGYNGATNRNYIDPNLIGGVQIFKGGTRERDVHTGIGGGMVIRTLEPEDVVREGEEFGVEFRVEGSSNAVDPKLPTLHTGEDFRTVDGYPQDSAGASYPYNDTTLMVTPASRSSSDDNPLGGEDYAYRLAAARKGEQFDFLAAYAYRERGNYFSGENNTDYFSNEAGDSTLDYIRSMANYWKPGTEVTNTSSQMESWLLKATWHLSEEESLGLIYRNSESIYGEIMPTRISLSEERGTIQWPLSQVDTQAYTLEYSYEPEDNRWVDFHANLWRTDTLSDTYSAGGFPNFTSYFNNGDPILRNTAVANATNTRDGFTVSNRMELNDALSMTLLGRFQKEKLSSDDEYTGDDNWRMFPRAGRREEWEGGFDLAWQPMDRLYLNAGLTYSSYWAFDDFLDNHEGQITQLVPQYYKVTYRSEYTYTDAERNALIDKALESLRSLLARGLISQDSYDQYAATLYDTYPRSEIRSYDGGTWRPDEDGNYSRATHPCFNGEIQGDDVVSCQALAVNERMTAEARKRKDHGWVPHFGIGYRFTDFSRMYLRYTETLRYPSMFESTMGFSASLNPWDLKPEHARNWELAYIQDLTPWFSGAEYADLKLTYYHNDIRDVIERDNYFNFRNIERQLLRGIELDARYDSGRFFTSLGLNYSLENKACDEHTAAMLTNNRWDVPHYIPSCFKYGYPNGYLLAQAAPDLSINWSLGGRFLNRKLELGSRFTWHKAYKNRDLENYTRYAGRLEDGSYGFTYFANTPFSWDETLLVDAYANYRINDSLSLELVGLNLTDLYYVDPTTRSPVAAPGRTLKLSLTGRF